ncbi:MAG: Ig-like domain-containing protein, partial [Candidatus Krumholzibacteria bacterium]|nr:Ig-like domain-containing protein [Candidatus Krumholzibacteria bacterium]
MSGKLRWSLFILTHMLIVSLMLLGAGCSESTSPDGNGGETDTTPPELSSVTPTDNSHIEVSFNEEVDEATAQHRNNYAIHRYGIMAPPEFNPPKSSLDWGDTLYVESSVLQADGESVLLSTYPPMIEGGTYHLIADNVKDLNGNAMTGPDTLDFVGVSTPDETPPEIVDRSPYPGETGIGISQSVMVTFSEPMSWSSVQTAFSWTGPGDIDVPFEMGDVEPHIFSFTPQSPLEYNTTYSVAFAANTTMDYSGNYLDAASWSFTTTNTPDTAPPTVVSTTPDDGAINVALDVILLIEFSEPIDPYSMEEGGIIMTPEPGDGIVTWTNGGSTLNFDPDDPLLDDTSYSLLIVEGAVRDYAGNPLSGNYSVIFTTGASLPTGGYSGTISGDPNSTAAANPEGALSIAFMVNMFTYEGDEGPPPIGGFDEVISDGSYEIGNLEDGTYWPGAMMDTDGNGEINPEY